MNFVTLDEETKRRVISTYVNDHLYLAEPEAPLILCGYEFELLEETSTSKFVRLYQITTEYTEDTKTNWPWTRWKLDVVYEIHKDTNTVEYSEKFRLPESEIHPDTSIELSDLFDTEACLKAAKNWLADYLEQRRNDSIAEVNKASFEEVLKILGTKNKHQEQWLKNNEIEFEDLAGDFLGKFVDRQYLDERIEVDGVEELLAMEIITAERAIEIESSEKHPSLVLSQDELDPLVKKELYAVFDDGDFPGIYASEIKCQDDNIVVIFTKRGYSFSEIEHELEGIFRSTSEAVSILYDDGYFLDDGTFR